MRYFLLLILLPGLLRAAEPIWEKIEGCTLVQEGYRDGDSFLVRIAPRTFRVFRLYFVDACEDSADSRYPERLAEQAAYFGITPARAAKLGDEAAEFSAQALAKPFTVFVCGQKAPGSSSRQRYYAMIETAEGKWLSSSLVENGLARIYGKRITLPDGTDSRQYRETLEGLEARVKVGKNGGWGE